MQLIKKIEFYLKLFQNLYLCYINRLKCCLTTFEMQVCENNRVRKITRVKSKEGRQEMYGGAKGRDASAEELDRETGEVRSRLQWAEHVERMADGRLPKRAAELHVEGRRRRGRPMLRWERTVK